MKIIKVAGGLGNQMFQYAFGEALKARGNKVLLDLRWFARNHKLVTHRDFDMLCFNVDFQQANAVQRLFCEKVKEKEENVFEPELLTREGNVIYGGYFQCEKYFADIRDIILKKFSLKAPMNEANNAMLQKVLAVNAVSLHVRRGDYLKYADIYGVCDVEYYNKAVKYVMEHVDNPNFFLFSDDVAWVRENIKIEVPFTVVDINDGKTAYCDLWLMKNCKHNIIANSSFSWWGAWLNENEGKIVVTPERWLANGDKTDIIPESWVKGAK